VGALEPFLKIFLCGLITGTEEKVTSYGILAKYNGPRSADQVRRRENYG